jgi:hypothetical protein
VHRIFQRYAGTDHAAALAVLSALVLAPLKLKEPGIWELGTSNGMYVIELKKGELSESQLDVITWCVFQ